MVSNRTRYVSESTTDEEVGDVEYLPNNQVLAKTLISSLTKAPNITNFQQSKSTRRPTRTPKCFTKNALMARENRLKKKMYITTLENHVSSLKNKNKKLTQVVDNQSFLIEELKKEVKYLKSVLANSDGIGKLIQAINSSTGMAVTSSLEKKMKVNTTESSSTQRKVPEIKMAKQRVNSTPCSSAFDFTRHPWEETDPCDPYVNYPTPESTKSCYGSPGFEELTDEGLLLDMDLPIQMNSDELLDMIDEKVLESPTLPIEEHNYHSPIITEQSSEEPVSINEDEDVGVCLHVSKNKVSLEFCPSCSDNAVKNWKSN